MPKVDAKGRTYNQERENGMRPSSEIMPTLLKEEYPEEAGRIQSEWVAALDRDRWPECVGIRSHHSL
jgi:hypothetical protein